MQDALLAAIGQLAGSSAQVFQARTATFYEEQIRPLYRPGALQALEEHREAGDRLVLLTTSSDYLSELVSQELRLDGILCNRFEVDAQGLHTGRPLGDLCFGSGKLTHAERYAQQAGVALSRCAFYTDSYSDLPVLEVVGKPVVVNPDYRLRREAARRGWPVMDWGVPTVGAGAPAPG
jgi:HAD superfamily hydrolase (TIGR01490 family)